MVSIFELFKIGIGPSSSHTVGPMVGACRFANQALEFLGSHPPVADASLRVEVELFGSLALTGIGHATDIAILAGLSGHLPATSEPEGIAKRVSDIRATQTLQLGGKRMLPFLESRDLLWRRNDFLPEHPNGFRIKLVTSNESADDLEANRGNGEVLFSDEYFSTGGGFVYSREELSRLRATQVAETASEDSKQTDAPFPFRSAKELMAMCRTAGKTIDEIVDANELVHRSEEAIVTELGAIWQVMRRCIDRGCQTAGLLPGPLGISRRAPRIFQQLTHRFNENLGCPSELENHPERDSLLTDPLQQLDWVSLFALAVNEENAAGGKVVTAPTNGAAGVIPAVLAYYLYFYPNSSIEGMHKFFKTAGAVGLLYKRNASLSAAEMGCQGEVGVACSMAAAGLAAVMGGTIEQIENAAEIGMEHNLGLTCDPIGGLVQIPCIERNTMGAAKAINAARLAVLYGDGKHFVSLDRVIETMRQTGVDMQLKYKETSLGGLAVNVVDC
ncbi:L-serine ammonia-lyase [Pirellulaceae bacterium SH467]